MKNKSLQKNFQTNSTIRRSIYDIYCDSPSEEFDYSGEIIELCDPEIVDSIIESVYEADFEQEHDYFTFDIEIMDVCEPKEAKSFIEDIYSFASVCEDTVDCEVTLPSIPLILPQIVVERDAANPYLQYNKLWEIGEDNKVSSGELISKASPVMQKQDLSNAISAIANIAIKQLPLCTIDKVLYLQKDSIWIPIEKFDLYQELDANLSDPNLLAGLSDRGITELYNKVSLARSIVVNPEEILPSPHLIACQNGVYDVFSGVGRAVRSGEYFFSCIQVSIDEIGKGSGEYFEAFLDNLSGGANDVKHRFLEVLGVMLSGYMPKKFFLFLGERDTGKSQAANLIRLLLKQSAMFSIADPNELSAKWTLGNIHGKRFVYCPDSAKIPLTQQTVAVIKQVSGNDLLRGELKHQQPFTYVNEAKLLFISNHLLSGALDDALMSRLIVVPFKHSVPPHKQIPDLADKLYQERGYIVEKALHALKRLIRNNFVFTRLTEDISGFSFGTTSPGDNIEEFVTDCCVLDEHAITSTEALFSAYLTYCDKCGVEPLSCSSSFGRNLAAFLPQLNRTRNAGGNGIRGFIGIGLRQSS